MTDGYVRTLADGEELVIEWDARRSNDDPRERAIEVRRLALDESAQEMTP